MWGLNEAVITQEMDGSENPKTPLKQWAWAEIDIKTMNLKIGIWRKTKQKAL